MAEPPHGSSDETAGGPPVPGTRGLPRRLAWRVAATRLAMTVEALWPPAAAVLCILGLYAAATLAGLWAWLPGAVHWLAFLAALGASGAVLVAGLRGVRVPDAQAALRRMEQRAGLRHRPLTSLADARAGFRGTRDDGEALWTRHRARQAAAIEAARAAPPRSALARYDRFAIRAAVGLLLVAALVSAGREAPGRLAASLLPGLGLGSTASIAFDAWITPPAYTGVAPLFLNQLGDAGTQPVPAITVPEGSVLTARVYGASAATARLGGTRTPFGDDGGALELAMPMATGGPLVLAAGGRTLAEAEVTLTPDLPPQISFADGDALAVTAQLTLAVSYDLIDDYGITRAEMRLALPDAAPPAPEATADGAPDEDAALGALAEVPAPAFKLSIPSVRVRDAEDEFSYFDLTSHPWAGLQVEVTLAAVDDAGQEGVSETRLMRLPQRRFSDPVARAVIEQRRKLARDPDAAPDVARALGGLTLHAERFYETANDYLPLRAAYWRLRNADRPGDLDGIYDLLWDIALHFEDGGLSLAESALRDAQDALMEALASGAGPEEIDRLMAELRQAMEEFLTALGEQQMQAGQSGERMPMSPDMQAIDQGDLEGLLDALQDLARSGSQEAARELLAQLRSILENLATTAPGPGQMTPPQSAMNDAIEGMGGLMDEQRALQDDTVRENNAQPPGTSHPGAMPPGSGMPGTGERGPDGEGRAPGDTAGGSGALGQRQGDLRGRLGELRDGLEGSGVPAPSAMGRAERAMREAERALGEGDLDRAARRQGEAIESLRDTAQALAETLLEDLAMSGEQQGQDRGRGGEGRDPLGRPQRTAGPQRGDGVEVPEESDIQRARRILEELQRRAGDRSRPPIELDYLNRLLERF